MRLGVVSDVHGNATALAAVLADGANAGVDRWWALGDLVLFGPRPVEVIELLEALPGVAYVSGNTERYVRTGAQPAPHATAVHAAGDVDLVERYGAMAGAIGWTKGALSQAGRLDWLASLPSQQRTTLPDGTTVLGIHASPGSDDGPGIDTDAPDRELHALLANAGADIVIGGHTHIATDRTVGCVRALNPGSVGMPKRLDGAAWMLVDATEAGVAVEHRRVAFDVDAVAADLHRRGYPAAAWVESMLRRTHPFAR